MLLVGMVRECKEADIDLICSLSMALKGSGKYRLCLNLRPLNFYLRRLKFQLETLQRVRHIIRRDDWLVTITTTASTTTTPTTTTTATATNYDWKALTPDC